MQPSPNYFEDLLNQRSYYVLSTVGFAVVHFTASVYDAIFLGRGTLTRCC